MRFGAITRLFTLTLFAAATSLAAHADTETFTFTPTSGDLGYSFSFPSTGPFDVDPGVATAYAGSFTLSFTDPSLSFDNFSGLAGFYNTSDPANTPVLGGPSYDFVVVDPASSAYFFYLGPQLYTGTEADPIFTDGSFALIGASGQPDGTLTITTTPEPSSLVLLGTGAIGVFSTVRRKLRKA